MEGSDDCSARVCLAAHASIHHIDVVGCAMILLKGTILQLVSGEAASGWTPPQRLVGLSRASREGDEGATLVVGSEESWCDAVKAVAENSIAHCQFQ